MLLHLQHQQHLVSYVRKMHFLSMLAGTKVLYH